MNKKLLNLSLYLKCQLFYSKSYKWSKAQVEDYHNLKLIEVVKHAGKNVPYYRQLFNDAGIDPIRFRGLEDIEKIPLLDKNTFRSRNKEFIADNAQSFYPVWKTTSGSTGTPLNIMLDIYSIRNKYAVIARASYWAGAKIGRPILMIKGLSESKPKDYGYEWQRNLFYLNCSRMTKANCLAFAKLVNRYKPRFFVGFARSYIDFYTIVTDAGMTLPSPIGIMCEGESITPAIRSFVEQAYNTKLYDQYGNNENSIMACEMPNNKKYFMEDYFYPELVDSEGNVTDTGYGELVSTSFYNYAMPLIRYKTRDYVRLADPQDNTYTSFRQIDMIEGRMDDFLILPDGRKIYFAEGALGYAKGIVTGQYIQDAPDHLTINLIVDDEFKSEFYPDIERGLRKRIGDGLRFDFKIVSELERKNSGKTPFIINKLQL